MRWLHNMTAGIPMRLPTKALWATMSLPSRYAKRGNGLCKTGQDSIFPLRNIWGELSQISDRFAGAVITRQSFTFAAKCRHSAQISKS